MTIASTFWLTTSSMRLITAATSPLVSMTLTSQPFVLRRGLEALDVELRARLGEVGRDDGDLLRVGGAGQRRDSGAARPTTQLRND